ncbi:hypothetical protein [Paenibacillus sp.]
MKKKKGSSSQKGKRTSYYVDNPNKSELKMLDRLSKSKSAVQSNKAAITSFAAAQQFSQNQVKEAQIQEAWIAPDDSVQGKRTAVEGGDSSKVISFDVQASRSAATSTLASSIGQSKQDIQATRITDTVGTVDPNHTGSDDSITKQSVNRLSKSSGHSDKKKSKKSSKPIRGTVANEEVDAVSTASSSQDNSVLPEETVSDGTVRTEDAEASQAEKERQLFEKRSIFRPKAIIYTDDIVDEAVTNEKLAT